MAPWHYSWCAWHLLGPQGQESQETTCSLFPTTSSPSWWHTTCRLPCHMALCSSHIPLGHDIAPLTQDLRAWPIIWFTSPWPFGVPVAEADAQNWWQKGCFAAVFAKLSNYSLCWQILAVIPMPVLARGLWMVVREWGCPSRSADLWSGKSSQINLVHFSATAALPPFPSSSFATAARAQDHPSFLFPLADIPILYPWGAQ